MKLKELPKWRVSDSRRLQVFLGSLRMAAVFMCLFVNVCSSQLEDPSFLVVSQMPYQKLQFSNSITAMKIHPTGDILGVCLNSSNSTSIGFVGSAFFSQQEIALENPYSSGNWECKSLGFSSDGMEMYIGSDKGVAVYSIEMQESQQQMNIEYAYSIRIRSFTPANLANELIVSEVNESMVYLLSSDGTVVLLKTGENLSELARRTIDIGYQKSSTHFQLTYDEKYLVASSGYQLTLVKNDLNLSKTKLNWTLTIIKQIQTNSTIVDFAIIFPTKNSTTTSSTSSTQFSSLPSGSHCLLILETSGALSLVTFDEEDSNQMLNYNQTALELNYNIDDSSTSSNKNTIHAVSIAATSDRRLIIGARSRGLFVFDCTDYYHPKLYHTIPTEIHPIFAVILTPKRQLLNPPQETLIISDSHHVLHLFNSSSPNLNNYMPNVFNSHKQTLIFSNTSNNAEFHSCTIQQGFIFAETGYDKLVVLSYNYSRDSFNVSAVDTLPADDQLRELIGSSQSQDVSGAAVSAISVRNTTSGDIFLDFSVGLESEFYLLSYQLMGSSSKVSFEGDLVFNKAISLGSELGDIHSIDFNQHLMVTAISRAEGLTILKEQDTSSSLESSIIEQTPLNGSCVSSVFSSDGKYLLTILQEGLTSIDLYSSVTQDISTATDANATDANATTTTTISPSIIPLTLPDKFYENNFQFMIGSQSLQNVIYFLDGLNGVEVVKSEFESSSSSFSSSSSQTITPFGSLVVPTKWVSHLSLTSNEEFGFISSADNQELILVDLNKKTFPSIIKPITNMMPTSTCINIKQKFLIGVSSMGLSYLPLENRSWIHSETVKINNADFTSIDFHGQRGILKIGESYKLTLTQLYPSAIQPMLIEKVEYLKDHYELFSLSEEWADWNKEHLTMKLVVFKEQEGPFVLIFKTCFVLSAEDFDMPSVIATSSNYYTGEQIFEYLMLKGLINPQNNCPSELFLEEQEENKIEAQLLSYFKNAAFSSQIVDTLKLAVDYYPIIYEVQASLALKINATATSISSRNSNDFIKLTLFFTGSSKCVFVKKQYLSLLSSISLQQTTLVISGAASDLNNLFASGVLYHETTLDASKTANVTVQLEDYVNYAQIYTLPVETTRFLVKKQFIRVHNPLAIQVAAISSGASFPIEQQISVDFLKKSFVDPDADASTQTFGADIIPITYSMQRKINGEFVVIATDFYIKFDAANIRVLGMAPYTALFSKEVFRIVASNGYNEKSDEFSMEFNSIPISFMINVILKFLGPFAFAIGVYQKRNFIMNIIYRKETLYSMEQATVHQLYRKKITLIGSELEIAHLFFDKFLRIALKAQLARSSMQLNIAQNKNKGFPIETALGSGGSPDQQEEDETNQQNDPTKVLDVLQQKQQKSPNAEEFSFPLLFRQNSVTVQKQDMQKAYKNFQMVKQKTISKDSQISRNTNKDQQFETSSNRQNHDNVDMFSQKRMENNNEKQHSSRMNISNRGPSISILKNSSSPHSRKLFGQASKERVKIAGEGQDLKDCQKQQQQRIGSNKLRKMRSKSEAELSPKKIANNGEEDDDQGAIIENDVVEGDCIPDRNNIRKLDSTVNNKNRQYRKSDYVAPSIVGQFNDEHKELEREEEEKQSQLQEQQQEGQSPLQQRQQRQNRMKQSLSIRSNEKMMNVTKSKTNKSSLSQMMIADLSLRSLSKDNFQNTNEHTEKSNKNFYCNQGLQGKHNIQSIQDQHSNVVLGPHSTSPFSESKDLRSPIVKRLYIQETQADGNLFSNDSSSPNTKMIQKEEQEKDQRYFPRNLKAKRSQSFKQDCGAALNEESLAVISMGRQEKGQKQSKNFLKIGKILERTGSNLNKTETEIPRMQNEDTKDQNFLRRSDCMRFNDYQSKKGDDEDQSPPEKKKGQLKQAIKFLHKEKKVQRTTHKNKYNTLIVQSQTKYTGSQENIRPLKGDAVEQKQKEDEFQRQKSITAANIKAKYPQEVDCEVNDTFLLQGNNEIGNHDNNNNQPYSVGNKKMSKDYLQTHCIGDDGSVRIDKLILEMLKRNIEVVYMTKKYRFRQFEEECNNITSRFYKCLHACVVAHLLEQDTKTLYLLKYLKCQGKQIQANKNDWYKAFLDVIPTPEVDSHGIPIPFSKLQIKLENLANIFKDLQLLENNPIASQQDNQTQQLQQQQSSQDNRQGINELRIKIVQDDFQTVTSKDHINDNKHSSSDNNNNSADQAVFGPLKSFGIHPELLKEALFCQAHGLFLKKRLSKKKCFGESLHLLQHQVFSVEAFKKIQHSRIMCLRRCLNLTYSRLPISKHMQLPSWINYDCKNGIIILEGVPTHQDIEEILIRIYDPSQFVTLQFSLNVIPMDNEPLQQLSSVDQSNFQDTSALQQQLYLLQKQLQQQQQLLNNKNSNYNKNINNSQMVNSKYSYTNDMKILKPNIRSVQSIFSQHLSPINGNQISLNYLQDMSNPFLYNFSKCQQSEILSQFSHHSIRNNQSKNNLSHHSIQNINNYNNNTSISHIQAVKPISYVSKAIELNDILKNQSFTKDETHSSSENNNTDNSNNVNKVEKTEVIKFKRRLLHKKSSFNVDYNNSFSKNQDADEEGNGNNGAERSPRIPMRNKNKSNYGFQDQMNNSNDGAKRHEDNNHNISDHISDQMSSEGGVVPLEASRREYQYEDEQNYSSFEQGRGVESHQNSRIPFVQASKFTIASIAKGFPKK